MRAAVAVAACRFEEHATRVRVCVCVCMVVVGGGSRYIKKRKTMLKRDFIKDNREREGRGERVQATPDFDQVCARALGSVM